MGKIYQKKDIAKNLQETWLQSGGHATQPDKNTFWVRKGERNYKVTVTMPREWSGIEVPETVPFVPMKTLPPLIPDTKEVDDTDDEEREEINEDTEFSDDPNEYKEQSAEDDFECPKCLGFVFQGAPTYTSKQTNTCICSTCHDEVMGFTTES